MPAKKEKITSGNQLSPNSKKKKSLIECKWSASDGEGLFIGNQLSPNSKKKSLIECKWSASDGEGLQRSPET
jgi:hypothetical protein